MIHQLNFDGKDKVDIAIDRYRGAAKIAGDEGLYLCFSGGKDSCVIKALADMAGVKYDAHYNVTGIDPPELIYFIRQHHPDVTWDYPHYPDDYYYKPLRGKRATMWNLIAHKSMPPTQIVRYCCQWLKETGGQGRLAVTGVRWAESVKRKANQGLYTVISPSREIQDELLESESFQLTSKGGVILNNDNNENREQIEYCYKQRKTVFNPIIDWTTAEVWEFLREYDIPYCSLYDEGCTRLGCIGCPMSTRQAAELERWPGFKKLYLNAFAEMLKRREEAGKETEWKTPEDVMKWWIR